MAFLSKQPDIAFVADAKKANEISAPQDLKEAIINGYNSDRAGSIVIILKSAGIHEPLILQVQHSYSAFVDGLGYQTWHYCRAYFI